MAGQPEERMAKRRRTMPEYVKGVETSNEGEAGIEAEPNYLYRLDSPCIA